MKKIVYCILIIGQIWSCKTEEKTPKYTIINGTITNTKGGPLNFTNTKGFKKTINVKDNGAFVDTLYIEEGPYTASYGKEILPMYFTKGAHINVTAQANNISNTLTFTGDYADFNNYYAYKSKKNMELMMNSLKNAIKEESEYLQFINDLKLDLEQQLANTQASEKLKVKEKRAIGYFIQSQLTDYLIYHPYFTKKENFEVSESFKKQHKKLDYNQLEDYYYSSEYNRMVFVGIMRKAHEMTQKDSTLTQGYAELKVASEIENETIRELLLTQYADLRLAMMTEGRKAFFNKYISLSKDPEQQAKIKELYQSLQKLESGMPSPKFVNYENYAGGTTSLDDLKGKYVYIDVWATWCGPCKAEIPFLKEIEEKYHGKNIAFVSISVDEVPDYQKWKDMIAEKEMGGVQLFADAAFDSQFIEEYKIKGIPQFILLDPKGNIIQASAPRPSDKKLIDLFNKLNI